MKKIFVAIAGVACFAASFVAREVHGDAPAPAASVSREDGVRAFAQIANVLQSPRCMNCHPVGDAPLNGDHAALHRHEHQSQEHGWSQLHHVSSQ